MESAQGDTDITNHIPRVFATQDFPYHTGTVRKALGIPAWEDGHPSSRLLRVIVFPRLRPITSLKRRFVYSWLECVRCHFKLWKLGFEHRDPSLGNLMVDPVTRRGVLNDWDLSYCSQLPQSAQPHGERTGTVPFMAVDLLSKGNWRGKKPRLYRHDLEGLIWILPWVFIQYENSTFKEAKLKTWRTGDYSMCGAAKKEMLDEPNMYDPMASWKGEWRIAETLLTWLRSERGARDVASYHRSRQYHGDIEQEEHDGDAVHAAPLVYPSRDVAEDQFASTDDEGEALMQEIVAGHYSDEQPTDGDLTSDQSAEVAELTAEQVYESFCYALYSIRSLRPALRKLGLRS